ncbi:MAG: peptide deformylase [Gammaproteobacteria bacterium]|nr:peptide deformylase [Gammaproteobacteria bacterium]
MSILEILQYPDLRLRRKSHPVTDVKATKIQKIIETMTDTLLDQESCAGLASTQLDIGEPPSIVVINPSGNKSQDSILCLINPQITATEGDTICEEGCMSVCPTMISARIKRASKINVVALDIDGNKLEFEAEGFLARCIQHECDHLQGILYIDHLSKLKRAFLDKKIAKLLQTN